LRALGYRLIFSMVEPALGMELHVPLRCACPTRNQTADGTRYLLTYLVNWDDCVPDIAERFNVSVRRYLMQIGFQKKIQFLFLLQQF
jgi:hypothetical protein